MLRGMEGHTQQLSTWWTTGSAEPLPSTSVFKWFFHLGAPAGRANYPANKKALKGSVETGEGGAAVILAELGKFLPTP